MPQQFSPFLLQSDGCCITHPVPYYRCLIAAGPEEVSTLRLLSSTRSTHMLANLGLGRHLDLTGTGLLTASVLSDHPLIPHFEAELRTFAEGFVVEKIDGATCLPMLISFGAHVDRVWSVDTTEFLEQALKLQSGAVLADPHLPPVEVQSGMMMIFRLKCGDDVMVDEADGQSLNPLERSMPFTTRTKSKQEQQGIQGIKYIAIVVRTGMRSAAAIGAAFAEWRVGMRLNDVHEHRGVGDVTLPRSLLRAYLSLLDYWAEGISNMMTGLSHNSNETFTAAAAVASTGVLPEPPQKQQKQQNQQRGRDHGRFITGHSLVAAATSYRKLVTTAVSFAHFPMLQIPGAGFYAMRCVHTLSDAQRLSLFLSSQSTDMILAEEDAAAATTTATTTAATTSTTVGEGKLMLLVGHAGSGITCVSRNLLQQWSERMTSSESFTNVFIDFGVLQVTSKDPDTPADKGQLDRFIDRCCAAATGSPPLSGNHTIARCDFVVVTAVLSPTQHIPVNMLMNLLSRKFGMPPSAVITVLVPVQLALSDEAEYGSDDAPAADEPYIFAHRLLKDSGYGLGGEYWRSMGMDALASGCCDIALAVDDLADTTTTSSSNSGGGGASASSSGTGRSDGALAYRAFRGYLSVINPSAQIDRLTPMNLRLDTETLELILNTIELQNTTPLLLSSSSSSSSSASGSREGSLLTERQSYAIARGFPALSSLQSLTPEATYLHNFAAQRPLNASSSVGDAICVGVTAVRISPAALGVESWNFSHVLRVLQLLFPQAKVSAASIDDTTWKVPPKPTSATTGSSRQQSHFERLIQLARAKALCSKQNEEGRRWFQQRLNELLPSTTHSAAAAVTKNGSPSPGSNMNTLILDRLIRGIRSVHGTISLPTGIKAVHTPAEVHASASVSVPVATSALLEAGSAFVIVRPAASALAIEEKLGDDLIVQGIFGVQEETLLKDLFKMCAQYKLNPKPLLTVDRVSERDRHAVQRNAKYSNKFELPGGWWYDGQSYINLNGDRKQLRPDIEQLLNLYIEDENTKIAEYNSLLSDLH